MIVLAACGTPDPTRHEPPNVLIFLADDLGFSDIGSYGGEISTPNLDRLARNGLRFTQFYNTSRCWPTRASLLTGHYAQEVRMDPPKGRLPPWARLLPRSVRRAGYRSYHSGKWHVTGAPQPIADGGFDRSFEVDDQDRYFTPRRLFEDDRRLPRGTTYATTAIADHAIQQLKEHTAGYADRPFFSYVAFTSPHFPLQAPPEDVDRYRDRYLEGWDVVRERRAQRLRKSGIVTGPAALREPSLAPRYLKGKILNRLGAGEVARAVAWDDLSPQQKRFQAVKMAIHAAMVERMDREIGHVLDQVRAMDAMENTVILFLSDNGADATILIRGDGHDPRAPPGSAASFLSLGPGWASASNSPFRRHKVWVHEGGISTPLIVNWPRGIHGRGELRRTPGHVIDIAPTILQLAAVSRTDPDAPRLPGRSLVPTFERDAAIRRDYLYFHHEGNRALRVGDWKLVSAREGNDVWELYDLGVDRAEQNDLAARHPERVRTMASRWKQLTDEFARRAGSP